MKKGKKKKKLLRIHQLLFLIMLLIVNSTAWFIYVNTVENTMNVHVKAWDVTFEAGDSEIVDTIDVTVDDLYPGMQNFTYDLQAHNRSEVTATVSYVLLEANILGDHYITEEGRAEVGQQVQTGDLTSAELEEMLAEDYPFTISFSLTNALMNSGNGSSTYSVNVVWPYEQGNDELDTEWGINAATYKSTHPAEPSIILRIKIKITQNAS